MTRNTPAHTNVRKYWDLHDEKKKNLTNEMNEGATVIMSFLSSPLAAQIYRHKRPHTHTHTRP